MISPDLVRLRLIFFALAEAAETTAMIFTIAFGALILNNFINVAGMPDAIVAFIQSLDISPIHVILVVLLIYILLGTIIEGLAMMPDVPLGKIFKGIVPFFGADIVRLLLVVFLPGLALWLPRALS